MKYQYIPTSELTEADTESVALILKALKGVDGSDYRIMGQALRYVVGPWKMTTRGFASAIYHHLENEKKLFEKWVEMKPVSQEIFHGNIGLDPDSEDEDDDVYVEIRLENKRAVIIVDAHSHGPRRLPK